MKPKQKGNLVKFPLKSAIAFLIITSASLVGAQTLQTLCFFKGTNGANPQAALTLHNDGNFYGTTPIGGARNYGTVFMVATNGALTTLYSFLGGTDGAKPYAALALGRDGNFYGTTYGGGSSNKGTVFMVTTNGALTTLHSFTGVRNSGDGSNPYAALTLGSDGSFYGTTYTGGGSNKGTVFMVTTNGALTTLYSFPGGADGGYPYAGLTLGSDDSFYGTTFYDLNTIAMIVGSGTVFRVTTNGTLNTIHVFTRRSDGVEPYAGLAFGSDGNLYGTTHDGGGVSWFGPGTVFKVATNGTLTQLLTFDNANGAIPRASLTLGSDGNFYGTTEAGGSDGYGTVFQVTTNGDLTTLYSFPGGTNGANPYAALALGSDGNFYGTTYGGGSGNYGTVFRLLLPPAVTVQPQSQTNNAGTTVIFSVSATSLHPMGFQWQKEGTNLFDGGNISGATNTTLTITGISQSDAAVYSVIVSNVNGSVTNYVTLTVLEPPVITAHPTNLVVLQGANVFFGVTLTGSASLFRYQWRLNGTNLLNATNAIYAIPLVTTNKAGNYSVVITNQAGSATGSNAALTVVVSPKSRTNSVGSTATFTATALSPEALNYQWQKNGTNLVDDGNIFGVTNSTLSITSVSGTDAGVYAAVVADAAASVTTSNAVLTVNNLPSFASQPQSQRVATGGAAIFSASAYGAPPLVFQWYFKGAPVGPPIAGTNVSTYTLTDVGTNQAGNYSVRVVNGYGSVTSSNALLTVLVPPSLALQLLAGYPLLNLYGMLGNNFVVEYNTNLAESNWLNLLALTNLSASPYQFLDPAGSGQPARFYRAFMR